MTKTSSMASHKTYQHGEDTLPNDTEIRTALQHDISYAIELLYAAYRPLLYSLAMRELKDHDNAEECVQNTFLSAFRYLVKVNQNNPSSFTLQHPKAWLCRILKNSIAAAKLHAAHYKVVSLSPYNMDDIEEEINRRLYSEDSERSLMRLETTRQLQALLQQLASIQQQVIVLRYVYNMKFAHIGKRLSIPENTARSHASRAIIFLQKYISQQPLPDGSFFDPEDCSYWEENKPYPFRAAFGWLLREEIQMDLGFSD